MPFKPEGWHSLTPRLIVEDAAGMVRFLQEAFGASGEFNPEVPAELQIGDCVLMVSDGGGLRQPTRSFFYLYVPDTDGACSRAVDAGARSIEGPADQPYGDRRATVEDPFANTWQLATRLQR